jgi:hypothetical protein
LRAIPGEDAAAVSSTLRSPGTQLCQRHERSCWCLQEFMQRHEKADPISSWLGWSAVGHISGASRRWVRFNFSAPCGEPRERGRNEGQAFISKIERLF